MGEFVSEFCCDEFCPLLRPWDEEFKGLTGRELLVPPALKGGKGGASAAKGETTPVESPFESVFGDIGDGKELGREFELVPPVAGEMGSICSDVCNVCGGGRSCISFSGGGRAPFCGGLYAGTGPCNCLLSFRRACS